MHDLEVFKKTQGIKDKALWMGAWYVEDETNVAFKEE